MKKNIKFLLSCSIIVVISACSAVQSTFTPISILSPTSTNTVIPTDTRESTPTSTVTLINTPIPTGTPSPTVTPVPTNPPTVTPDIAVLDPITVCTTDCDFVSIQAAIDDINTQPGNLILVTDPVHTEAGIVVNKDVVIQGKGVDQTIIQTHDGVAKDAPDRVFLIPPEANVEIRAMTIQKGNPHDSFRYGGGVLNQGTLLLSHVTISRNQADCGGGVVNQNGTLTIEYSTISDNLADGIAPQGLGCGSGGGIKMVEDGTLTMTHSTLSGNKAEKNGGGIHISCKSEAMLSNCTISNNRARRVGGGLSIGGKVSLTHCTISGNNAEGISAFQPVKGKAGGGIANSGTLNLENTIIANHMKSRGDCVLRSEGQVDININTLIEDGSCSPAYSGDPELTSLGDFGGATKTHALQPSSPALDVIAADECALIVDQRGQPRPVGQISIDTPCDIGAVEMNAN